MDMAKFNYWVVVMKGLIGLAGISLLTWRAQWFRKLVGLRPRGRFGEKQ